MENHLKLLKDFPKVGIIIVNYNGYYDTIECIASLLKLDYPNCLLIIVDNASPNNSLYYIHTWLSDPNNKAYHNKSPVFQHINYTEYKSQFSKLDKATKIITIQSGKNLGFAAANNMGIKFAIDNGATKFWILNNDTVVQNNSLTELVLCSSTLGNKKFGIIGSQLRYYHQREVIQAIGGKYQPVLGLTKHLENGKLASELEIPEKSFASDYAIGASLLVTLEFIQDVGMMSEDYFLYFEELDWHLRGKRKGWSHLICTNSVVFHKEGASIGTGKGDKRSELSDLYYLKSKLLFTKKFYPIYLLIVYVSYIGIIFKRILRRQYDRAWKILILVLKSLKSLIIVSKAISILNTY